MDVFSLVPAAAWYFARLFITKRWLAFIRRKLKFQNAKFSTFWRFPPKRSKFLERTLTQGTTYPNSEQGTCYTIFSAAINSSALAMVSLTWFSLSCASIKAFLWATNSFLLAVTDSSNSYSSYSSSSNSEVWRAKFRLDLLKRGQQCHSISQGINGYGGQGLLSLGGLGGRGREGRRLCTSHGMSIWPGGSGGEGNSSKLGIGNEGRYI